ncbi:MAG: hypothetical protein JKY54_02515 [Flavobacteriales bacterium]|nr:hypothetical protein [Flavobacteriales bacterium]
MAKINRGNPIDLSIENQYRNQATSVLYIVSEERANDPSQSIKFRIKNVDKQDYALAPLTEANATNYHFALVFRPGTLKYKDKEEIRAKFAKALEENWVVGALEHRMEDHAEILYLSLKAAWVFKGNTEIKFTVEGLSAGAGTGSRSTQVQLMYKLPIGAEYFTGNRSKHLDIVNHDGKTFAPLDFLILGDPTLIHKSVDNIVKIQMVETEGRMIRVSTSTVIDIKFPYYGQKPQVTGGLFNYSGVMDGYDPNLHPAWVLGKGSLVGSIKYEKAEKEETLLILDPVGNDINYGHWGYRSIQLKFRSNESINNLISKFINVPAFGAIGDASIKISVRNLPGYWDTDFEVKISKTLIASRYNDRTKINHSFLEHDTSTNGRFFIGKNDSLMEKDDAWINSPTHKITDPAIIFSPAAHGELDHAWIRFHSRSRKAHNLEIQVGDNAGDHLVLNSHLGNIGLGTLNPQEKIHLAKATRIDGDTVINGNLNVGGLGDKHIKVRHIQGKSHKSADPADLYLNYFKGHDVHMGSATNTSNLHVHGRITDATGDVMPIGAIIMWSGAINNLPAGWKLCNGADGTPDLRNRFIVGAGAGYGVGNTGGEDRHTLTWHEMPSHNHNITSYHANFKHSGGASEGSTKNDGDGAFAAGTTHAGGNQAHENRPPYYALAYIMKK